MLHRSGCSCGALPTARAACTVTRIACPSSATFAHSPGGSADLWRPDADESGASREPLRTATPDQGLHCVGKRARADAVQAFGPLRRAIRATARRTAPREEVASYRRP